MALWSLTASLPSLERVGQPPEGRPCLRLGGPGLREKLRSKLPRDSGCEPHWDVLRVLCCPYMCVKGVGFEWDTGTLALDSYWQGFFRASPASCPTAGVPWATLLHVCEEEACLPPLLLYLPATHLRVLVIVHGANSSTSHPGPLASAKQPA